jgi:hypothetical protein
MAAISQKIIGLVGGVSQQPDSLMLPGQLRECDNYYPDPTFGLVKRPGTQYVRRIDNSLAEGSWFFICKGLDEKLILQVGYNGTMRLWDAQSGIQQTMNALSSSATAYATHINTSDLEVLQINDYIFVLNRSVFVEDDTLATPAQVPFGYVTLTTIAYDTSYTVTIDGNAFTYNTPTASGSNLNANIIISNLVSTINANPAYVATGIANFIHIRRANNADFSLEASGSLTGTGLRAYKGTVNGVEDLPDQFLDGEVITVGGSGDTGFDNYYLIFETSDGSARGAGVWVETIGPGVSLGIDPTTMPHAIIREANGTYTFRELSETAASAYTSSTTVNGIPTAVSVTSTGYARWSIGQTFSVYGGTGFGLRLKVTSIDANRKITGVSIVRAGQDYTATDVVTNNEGDTFTITTVGFATISGSTWADQYWSPRTVGDEDSAPSPSFVGERISGMSFFKNRLILMSQENIVCSQAGDFLNFYPSTVITVVDSDPIDISAGSTTRIEFRHALQQPTGLLIFADNSQYILQTRTEAFAPSTAELNLISSFSHSGNVPPVDLGSTVVVIEENDKSIAVNELTINIDQQPLKKDLSKLIPSYIPRGIDLITNSLSASVFGLTTIQDPNTIYIFRYYTQDNERLLASWFKWTFPCEVLLLEFHEDEVYIILKGDDKPILCQMQLLTETPGGAIFFEDKYVDLRMDVFDYYPTIAYDAVADETKIFFREGVNIAAAQPCLVKLSANDNSYVLYPTMVEDLLAPAGQQYYVTVEGDQTAEQYALGYQIVSEARLPGFYVKKDKQADELNVPMVHRVRIYSHESGPFKSELTVPGRSTFTLTLPQITANVTGGNTAPMIRNAENTIPVMANGRDVDLKLICDAPFPLALITMIWEGTYNNKGIRSV